MRTQNKCLPLQVCSLSCLLCKSLHGWEHQSPDLLGLDIFQVLMGCSHLCDNGEKWLLIFQNKGHYMFISNESGCLCHMRVDWNYSEKTESSVWRWLCSIPVPPRDPWKISLTSTSFTNKIGLIIYPLGLMKMKWNKTDKVSPSEKIYNKKKRIHIMFLPMKIIMVITQSLQFVGIST